jgi:broad specificity phosphatase PhoE
MLANSTVLLIRHAEKPDKGTGLAPMGQARADGYAAYFPSLPLDRTGYDHLFASSDSSKSQRPRLTLTPLAERLNMRIEQPYANDDYEGLATTLLGSTDYTSSNIVICWHHGKILDLANLLLKKNPPRGWPTKWPKRVYGWLLWIAYDANEDPSGTCYS